MSVEPADPRSSFGRSIFSGAGLAIGFFAVVIALTLAVMLFFGWQAQANRPDALYGTGDTLELSVDEASCRMQERYATMALTENSLAEYQSIRQELDQLRQSGKIIVLNPYQARLPIRFLERKGKVVRVLISSDKNLPTVYREISGRTFWLYAQNNFYPVPDHRK